MDKHLEHLMNLVVEYTPHVLGALLVLIVGMWLIKRVTRLSAKAMEKRDLDVSLRSFLRSLISIGLKIFLIVTVAGMVGIGTTSFVTILGAAGLAVGLALQGSLSNFAGGVLILIFKPYKVGDTIEAQGQTGSVKEIQVFNTILLTGELKTVILPNGAVSNGTIINHSKHGTIRTEISITVSATNDLEALRKLIIDGLLAEEIVSKIPAPTVVVIRINEGAAILSIRAYSDHANSGDMLTLTNEVVNGILLKNKIAGPPLQKIMVSA
ncbi:MAG: mechanosensitive ion channel [Bacteroidetes bacterium]|nr:mechanosensitive ion channel [Bacteroidota bacterium]